MTPAAAPTRARLDLFSISVLILFLELACIRWFPAHVLFLTFFTNTVLLACFLGMSLGCLAAGSRRNYLPWTPWLLLLGIGAGVGIDLLREGLRETIDLGKTHEFGYFGTESRPGDTTRFYVPAEVVAGFFFLVIALALVGPGQELGRALTRVPDRVRAYTLNILGSVAGIVLFSLLSWLHLGPVWWFLGVCLGLAYFLQGLPVQARSGLVWAPLAALVLILVVPRLGGEKGHEQFWSPYYRIDYDGAPQRYVAVNLIGHQQMNSWDYAHGHAAPAYALPHLLRRHSGGQPFKDVLIIGAGSGNDVSRALHFQAEHVDAVEIDPQILALGKRDHPDKPYADGRVAPHLDDGRNFLRSSPRQYDVIVYALVDSLVLHSGYSDIRLESYLFTRQAFEDVRRHLKPGGLFVLYNFLRHGWVIGRLEKGLEEVFGAKPLVLTLPHKEALKPDESFDGFTIIMAGSADALTPLRAAFARSPLYWLAKTKTPGPDTPDGFSPPPEGDRPQFEAFGLTTVLQPDVPLAIATDDWPFLYVRQPSVPEQSLRSALMMGGLALVLLLVFTPRGAAAGGPAFDARMFFLGAGFMLIETKAVVHMALLFGSTWMVNSIVFLAVLLMILGANLFVLKVRPEKLAPFYLGLGASLALNVAIPLDFFLGMERMPQVILSCLLVFAPILFAGVIFAVSFARTTQADRAFGFNIAGAMVGGLLENTSMLLGFQNLMLLAIGLYALSALGGWEKKGETMAAVGTGADS